MDSDVLIKLTKIGSKEIIAGMLEIYIPKRVYEETVLESKGCPDAEKIQENIDAGSIHVSESSSQEKGEVESFRLFRLGGFELIASDDKKFLKFLEKCNIPYLTSSSLIVYLFDSLKAHISNDQYSTAISEVLRWER